MSRKNKSYQLTRLGAFAVHLLKRDYPDPIEKVVDRILAHGPADEFERQAIEKANAEDLPGYQKIVVAQS